MRLKKYLTSATILLLFLSGGVLVASSQSRNSRNYNFNYDSRGLDSTIRSLDAGTKRFVKFLDHELDRSRYNGSRFEDEINHKATMFRVSVSRFERVYRSGANERLLLYYAERMLNQGADLNRMLRRAEISREVDRQWEPIHEDLVSIARWHRTKGRNSNW